MTTIDHDGDHGAAPRPSDGGAAVRPWPRGLFPGNADEWTSLVRLAVLLAVIPALWVGVIPLTSPVLTPILALLGGYVILLAAGPRWVTGLGQADLTVGMDLVVTTLLVTVSGGIDSPFRYLYYLVILSAASRLNVRQAVAASFATAGIVVLLWIRTTGRATLITPGFEVGTFISGGFLLALILGVLTQEKRWIAVLYQTQARRTAELETLHRLGEHLRAARSTDDMLLIVTAEAMRVTGSDHAALLLPDPDRRIFTRASVSGLLPDLKGATFPYPSSIAAQAMDSQTPIRVDEGTAAAERSDDRDPERVLGPTVYSPVGTVEGQVGVLVTARRRGPAGRPFGDEEVRLLGGIAEIAASSIQRARLHQDLEEAYIQMVLSLAAAVDARDTYAADHGERLSRLAEAVARAMGCPEREIQDIRRAGQLHDIGKIGIPDSILHKAESLSTDEWSVMRQHPAIGSDILKPLVRMQPVAALIRHHQESWDGTGYPDGLQGEEIPLGARILAVVDAYSAMTDDRPFKRARLHEDAIREIQRHAGKQFDPQVVHAFCRVIPELRPRALGAHGDVSDP